MYECIEERPRKGDDEFREEFEDWVRAEEVDVYDPTIEKNCHTARVALGFEGDNQIDGEVCKAFKERQCNDLYEELQFLWKGLEEETKKVELLTSNEIE